MHNISHGLSAPSDIDICVSCSYAGAEAGSMFSDYILFIDESGDHGLTSIDRHYPVFVLCGVLIKKRDYSEQLSPMLCQLKMDFWGHDEIILHEHDIRKPQGIFSILQLREERDRFHSRIGEIFDQCDFQLIYSLIRKQEYADKYPDPVNPYSLSMSFVLERAFLEINSRGHGARKTHVIVEKRGAKEDTQLALAFERITNGNNACNRALPFDLVMIPKIANSPGQQIADLAARPLGIRAIRPDQANRAYEALRGKIRRDSKGKAEGWGVKVFP
jgi:hypothetical protein